jgi:hypothetical protein
MKKSNKILLVFFSLVLAVVACNLPAGLEGGEPTPLTVPELLPLETQLAPPPADTGSPEQAVDCNSPIEPGVWTGQVQLASSATRMGFRVVEQQSVLPISLQVACDGSVNGAAARSGGANLNVPLTLNGACTESADYQISGSAQDTADGPVLDLNLSTSQGALKCSIDSRIASVPSGDHSANLAGQQQNVRLLATEVDANRVRGNDWPDRLYQDQLPGLETMIIEAGLSYERSSSWLLQRQQD